VGHKLGHESAMCNKTISHVSHLGNFVFAPTNMGNGRGWLGAWKLFTRKTSRYSSSPCLHTFHACHGMCSSSCYWFSIDLSMPSTSSSHIKTQVLERSLEKPMPAPVPIMPKPASSTNQKQIDFVDKAVCWPFTWDTASHFKCHSNPS
jgi:hypothetical protein